MIEPVFLLWALGACLPMIGLASAPAGAPPGNMEAGPVVHLPAPRTSGDLPVEEALRRRRSVRSFALDPITLADLAQLLWAAQGITGPEGERTVPSAGALFPLEVYLVAGRVEGLAPGVYHYRPRARDLATVAAGDLRAQLAAAAHGQDWVQAAPASLVLAAVPKRTAAKYGSRAPRYVHMEAGAAAENVSLQGVALGIGSVFVGAFDNSAVTRLLRLARDEEPLLILPLGRIRK